ncbi:MAG: response regulator [Chloroflexota bacterium]|nr:response regulator [Anaerolineae bacterium]HMM28687.1 response regulator [Aggregatilineaceae bacterium]
MAQILVIDDDLNLLQMVRLMLERVGHQVETTHKGVEGLARAARMQPDLAIIDIMMPDLDGYDVVRRLRADPATACIPILVLTARSQEMDKDTALAAGANAFMSKPVTAQQLTSRVQAVLQAGVNYRVHTDLLTEPIRPAEAAPPSGARRPIGADAPAEVRAAPDTGVAAPSRQVIAISSVRGGAGGTTLAVNLAWMLARRGRRVALLDLSAVGGHLALHLHLPTPQHWGVLLGAQSAPDAAHVLALTTPHPSAPLALLGAPPGPTIERLAPGVVQAMVRALAAHWDVVMVDLAALDATAVAALQLAGLVVLVMTDDLCSVQTAQQTLGLLPALGVDRERIGVALCHVRPTADIPVETIQKALRRPLAAEIPYQAEQMAAIRRGVPLAAAEPDGLYAQALSALEQVCAQA